MTTLTSNDEEGGGEVATNSLNSRLPYGGGRLLVKGSPLSTAVETTTSEIVVSPVPVIETALVSETETANTISPNTEEVTPLHIDDTPLEPAPKESVPLEPAVTPPSEHPLTSPISPVLAEPLPRDDVKQVIESVSPQIDLILPRIAREKGMEEMKHSLAALSILEKMRATFERENAERIASAAGAKKALLANTNTINLSDLEEKDATIFSLAFLTACLARSGTTITETGLILSRVKRSGSVPFIEEKIGFKKATWDNASRRKMGEDANSTIALAPLISMEILLSLVKEEQVEPPKETLSTSAAISVAVETPASQSEAQPDVVAVGEDINTIVRDELLKQVGNVTPVEMRDPLSSFNQKIKWAIDEIQKDVRAYGIEGGIKLLTRGSPIYRNKIGELLKHAPDQKPPEEKGVEPPYKKEDVGSAALASELNTLNTLSGGTMATGRKDEGGEIAPMVESTSSAVNDAHGDEVSVIFLDDNFVKIIKLICKVTDATALEATFKKYASLTIKDFLLKLPEEGSLIAGEMTTFLNWSKNSYLKDKVALFDNLTLIYILTTIERGVSGTSNK